LYNSYLGLFHLNFPSGGGTPLIYFSIGGRKNMNVKLLVGGVTKTRFLLVGGVIKEHCFFFKEDG